MAPCGNQSADHPVRMGRTSGHVDQQFLDLLFGKEVTHALGAGESPVFRMQKMYIKDLSFENPIPSDALFFLAVLEYEGRDNPDKALTYLEAIPASHQHYERSLIFRIHLLYQKNERDAARELCMTAMTLFPKLCVVLTILSSEYRLYACGKIFFTP